MDDASIPTAPTCNVVLFVTMASIAEIVGIVVGVLLILFLLLCCCGLLLRARRRRRALMGGAAPGLDADERRFKRRLEQSMQEIDDIFENGDGDGDEHALDSDDIEQLQLLEAELSLKGDCRGVVVSLFLLASRLGRILYYLLILK